MNKPLLLAIDTAGPRLQLALATGSSLDVLVKDMQRGHAEVIFDLISELLQRNNVTYADLTSLAVTTGPGSFTGLRIGLSAARGLGVARALPVIGVPTLLAMSLSGVEGDRLAVLVDARRDEAYFQGFTAPGIPEAPAELLSMTDAQARAASYPASLSPIAADIGAMAHFALGVDPADWPPAPTYVRAADAKPQQKARIARTSEAG